MNTENYSVFVTDGEEKHENVIAGIAGAFIFALAGGVLWFLLYMIGFLTGISGFIGVICAIKGYALFAKKESKKGIVIAIIMAVLVIILAWYLCFAYDIFTAYQDWFEAGEIDYTITYIEAVRGVPLYIIDPEVGVSYLLDLGFGLLLCAVASVGYIVSAVKKLKAANNVANSPVPPQGINPMYYPTTPVKPAETVFPAYSDSADKTDSSDNSSAQSDATYSDNNKKDGE